MLGASERERFLSYVEPLADGCFAWRGALAHDGEPLFHLRGEAMTARLAAYLLFRGESDALAAMPAGMVTYPTCSNAGCVNPHHLERGTPARRLDAALAAQARRGERSPALRCRRGHPVAASATRCRSCAGSLALPRRARVRPSKVPREVG